MDKRWKGNSFERVILLTTFFNSKRIFWQFQNIMPVQWILTLDRSNSNCHYSLFFLIPFIRCFFLCGVAKDAQDPMANPAIIGFGLNEKGSWIPKGTLERNSTKLVSCVKVE